MNAQSSEQFTESGTNETNIITHTGEAARESTLIDGQFSESCTLEANMMSHTEEAEYPKTAL